MWKWGGRRQSTPMLQPCHGWLLGIEGAVLAQEPDRADPSALMGLAKAPFVSRTPTTAWTTHYMAGLDAGCPVGMDQV